MKKRLILLTALLSIALVGCGDNKDTNATVETSVPVETATPAPTVEPTATPTPEPTATPTPEPSTETEISKSEINDNDTQVAEGTVDEDNVDQPTETPETPAVENTDNTSDFELSEEIIQSLRYLGASDEQIGALKSESELKALVRQLTSFNGNSGSNSSSGSGSNSDSSGISGENEQDPSMIPQLGDPADAPAGRM